MARHALQASADLWRSIGSFAATCLLSRKIALKEFPEDIAGTMADGKRAVAVKVLVMGDLDGLIEGLK